MSTGSNQFKPWLDHGEGIVCASVRVLSWLRGKESIESSDEQQEWRTVFSHVGVCCPAMASFGCRSPSHRFACSEAAHGMANQHINGLDDAPHVRLRARHSGGWMAVAILHGRGGPPNSRRNRLRTTLRRTRTRSLGRAVAVGEQRHRMRARTGRNELKSRRISSEHHSSDTNARRELMGQDHSGKKANNPGRADGAAVSFQELSEPGSFGAAWGPVHYVVLHSTEVAANDHGNGKDAKPENWKTPSADSRSRFVPAQPQGRAGTFRS